MDEALVILLEPSYSIYNLGQFLDQSWNMKRQLANGITTPEIDEIHNAGIAACALGGKLLDADGGVFMPFIVRPENRVNLKQHLKNLSMLISTWISPEVKLKSFILIIRVHRRFCP